MLKFFKNFFQKKKNNLIAFIDIWAFWVKTLICDKKTKKILADWYSKNHDFCFQNWNICDIKSLTKSVSDSLNDAENKILQSVDSVIFWISWTFENFMQKNFRVNIEVLADEIWWKFEWFYDLNSLFCAFSDEKKSAIFVNIWANSTNISVIKDWKYFWNENFFLWWDLFTKRIAKVFAVSQNDAEKIKILFNSWKSKKFNLKTEDFKNDLDLFFTAFFVSLKNFIQWELKWKKLPNKIFLTWWASLFWELRYRFRSDKEYFKNLWFSWIPNIENLEFWEKFFKNDFEKSVFWGCLLIRKFYFR